MLKWLAGIAATIITGLFIWWLTHPGGPLNPVKPKPIPPTELSFLERATGTYTLRSWVEANRPIELMARITEGSLEIDREGVTNWSVLLEQTLTTNPGRVRMTARGQIQLDSQPPHMMGVRGGNFNSTEYLDDRWGQVSADVTLAVRGWDYGSPEDAFTLSLDTQVDGSQIFQMRNSRGTFTWAKTE